MYESSYKATTAARRAAITPTTGSAAPTPGEVDVSATVLDGEFSSVDELVAVSPSVVMVLFEDMVVGMTLLVDLAISEEEAIASMSCV